MKHQLWLLPAVCIYLLLTSATSVKVSQTSFSTGYESKASLLLPSITMKEHKMSFFERLIIKVFFKKYKKRVDELQANKLANTSLAFGIAACAFIVLGLLIPYVILAAIPAGIVAMITGASALRKGTTEQGKAKTGKALGLGTLIAFAVLLIVAAIALAAALNSWN